MESKHQNGRHGRAVPVSAHQSALPMDDLLGPADATLESDDEPLPNTQDRASTPTMRQGPQLADVGQQVNVLEEMEDDPELQRRAALGANAIAFVDFDGPGAKSNMVEALVDQDML